MMSRAQVLKNSQRIEFELIAPYLQLFIKNCVSKRQRARWTQFSKSIDHLALKFNALWKGLDQTKAILGSEFVLSSTKYIYLDLDAGGKFGFLLRSNEAQFISSAANDGMLFSTDKTHAIFLTHESEHYLYRFG